MNKIYFLVEYVINSDGHPDQPIGVVAGDDQGNVTAVHADFGDLMKTTHPGVNRENYVPLITHAETFSVPLTTHQMGSLQKYQINPSTFNFWVLRKKQKKNNSLTRYKGPNCFFTDDDLAQSVTKLYGMHVARHQNNNAPRYVTAEIGNG